MHLSLTPLRARRRRLDAEELLGVLSSARAAELRDLLAHHNYRYFVLDFEISDADTTASSTS